MAKAGPVGATGDIAFPPNDHVVTRLILERHSAQRPEAQAVVGPTGETWTWAEALRAAHRSASCLRSLGVAPGDRVLLFLPNGLDWLRAWWGISCLGAVMVTVNTAYRGDILRQVCDDSGASVIITNAELGSRLAALGLGLDVVAPESLATGAAGAGVTGAGVTGAGRQVVRCPRTRTGSSRCGPCTRSTSPQGRPARPRAY
jgi:crotonobetaine/carnitine-CoA ligase